jgi:NAD(P)H-dependent flavin oxidoreductase YrpB (nitropropane dioxygenase family)
MLAGVDYVLMGAGIPRRIPGVLDLLARGDAVELKIDVDGAMPGEEFFSRFDPAIFCGGSAPTLKRPLFLGIVASATLAMTLARKSNGKVDGFVVEGETAGGHNAPPRGALQLSAEGEPVYGPRDVPDLEKIRELGLPFWLAGSYGDPDRLTEALRLGAAGIQVGTAFAFCEESGIRTDLKQQTLRLSREGKARVFTDPLASPTGFRSRSRNCRARCRMQQRMPPGRASAIWAISDMLIARRMARSVIAAPRNRRKILSAKAAHKLKRKAGSASAMDWFPRSASPRFGPEQTATCPWSPPGTTLHGSLVISNRAMIPTPLPKLSITFWERPVERF